MTFASDNSYRARPTDNPYSPDDPKIGGSDDAIVLDDLLLELEKSLASLSALITADPVVSEACNAIIDSSRLLTGSTLSRERPSFRSLTDVHTLRVTQTDSDSDSYFNGIGEDSSSSESDEDSTPPDLTLHDRPHSDNETGNPRWSLLPISPPRDSELTALEKERRPQSERPSSSRLPSGRSRLEQPRPQAGRLHSSRTQPSHHPSGLPTRRGLSTADPATGAAVTRVGPAAVIPQLDFTKLRPYEQRTTRLASAKSRSGKRAEQEKLYSRSMLLTCLQSTHTLLSRVSVELKEVQSALTAALGERNRLRTQALERDTHMEELTHTLSSLTRAASLPHWPDATFSRRATALLDEQACQTDGDFAAWHAREPPAQPPPKPPCSWSSHQICSVVPTEREKPYRYQSAWLRRTWVAAPAALDAPSHSVSIGVCPQRRGKRADLSSDLSSDLSADLSADQSADLSADLSSRRPESARKTPIDALREGLSRVLQYISLLRPQLPRTSTCT